jgi:phospholipid/cholesterol/gamma-HCH transport system substrate-binding protein
VPEDRKPYRVVALTPVSGLNAQAQVRYRGMSVGRVTSIRLDPADRHRILVDIEVNSEIPVTRGTYAQLGMEGITGIAYVHLLDDSNETAPPPKGAGGLAELPLRPSFFDTVTDSAEGAVRDARELMAALNKVLTPENRKTIGASLASLEKITANLEAATAKLPQTVARADAWLGPENLRLARESLERVNETAPRKSESWLPRRASSSERSGSYPGKSRATRCRRSVRSRNRRTGARVASAASQATCRATPIACFGAGKPDARGPASPGFNDTGGEKRG